MRVKDPNHWTSDWQFARFLTEYLEGADYEQFAFLFFGERDDPIGRFGSLVAAEIVPYFEKTIGTQAEPIVNQTFAATIDHTRVKWPKTTLVVIEACHGESEFANTIEINKKGPGNEPFDVGLHLDLVGVHAIVHAVEEISVGRTNIERLADAVTDGILRFLHRKGIQTI